MTDSPGAILQKLESLGVNQNRVEKHLLRMDNSHNERLTAIEKTIGLIAVQDEKFIAIKQEQKAQWKILDDNFKQGGTIDQIKLHQAHCPIDRVEKIESKCNNIVDRVSNVELCQASYPIKNTRNLIAVMMSALVVLGAMLAAVFNMVVHQSEVLANLIKNGIK